MRAETKLLSYAKPYWHLFVLAIVIVLVSTYVEIMPPRIVKDAIDSYINNQNIPVNDRIAGVIKSGILFLIVLILRFFLNYGNIYLTSYLGAKIVYDIRRDLFNHVMRLPMSFFDRNPSGRITTRIVNDTQNVQEFFTTVVTSIIKDIFLLGGIIISLIQLSKILFIQLSYIFPIVIASMILFRYFDRKVYRMVRTNLARINAFLAEHIAGVSVVKIFNAEEQKKKEFDNIAKDYYKSLIKQLYVFGIFRPFMDFLYFLGLSLIIWFGAKYIMSKTIGFGALYAFASYLDMFFAPLRDIAEKYDIVQNSMASAEKIFNLFKENGEKLGKPDGKKHVEKGVVEFKNVWFSYDGKRWILKDVNIVFAPGYLTAIVGETGAGKTSLMNLLNGLYVPQKGVILVDDIPLQEYDLKSLRREIAVVPQDVVLFSGTILDNIRLFDESIPEEKVLEALEKVYAMDIVNKLEKGIHYEVVERGTTLSSGERQLIVLARAVLFDSKILVLDEATSNIDVETETRIQKALRELSKDKTVIMIAHRLSTVKDADRIIVIHNGQVVEEGKHRELLKRRGVYYKLYEVQFEI
ncbi:MAG: ABC transporter ATP-binding protein [Thermotogaceae bacterium]|nr:ABC transporter ATP-binding protein [Thermotogaceae bacterium]